MKTAFFISLAVKTKLYLDNSQDEGMDRESLLAFYDQYPSCFQFSLINPKHFQMKPLRPSQKLRPKVFILPKALILRELNEEMDVEGFSKANSEDIKGSVVHEDGEYD